ncbi:MAG: hypothetical protein DRN04_12860 [Thermoprotei archaeon]|nr:MAG: hypothetical protein DRN04_12860 [Thermoprotei archaeon]
MTQVRLKVFESLEDRGRWRVRVNLGVLRRLGVVPGGVVEVVGGRRTAAFAWPANVGGDVVGLSDVVLRNAGVRVGDFVVLRKAVVKEAVSVKLAPVDRTVPVDEGFVNYVRRRLLDYPLTIGDIVPVPVLGEPIMFKVVSTDPHGIVAVTSKTNVVVYEKPLEEGLARLVANLLKEQGYNVLHVGLLEDGADVVAEKQKVKLIAKIVREETRDAKTNFYIALGKLLMLMKDPNAEYALVLTENKHVKLTKNIPEEIKQKLRLRFLMLEKKYVVREVK